MTTKLIHLGLLTAITLSIGFAQDTLTIDQAVRRVMEHHPAIAQADQNVQASEARTLQSMSATYPDVSTEASYAFIGPIAKLSIPVLGDFRLFPADNYDAHIGGRYTVYDFGKVNATVDLNRSRTQSVRDAVDLTKNSLGFQTIRVFYTILYLEQSLQVQDEQIDALNHHLLMTKKRVSAGTATTFDILTTQVRVSGAENQKIDIQNAIAKQRAVLAQLLGLPSGTAIEIRGSFQQTPASTNADSLLQTALRQRTELKLAHDAEQSAILQQRVASLGNKPALKVNLAYGLKNGFIPDLDVLRGNWVAAIKAEVPIFDGWRTDHQQEEAQAVTLAEEARNRDLEQQVRSDVQQVIADVQSAASKISITELQVQHAKEAVSIAQTRYETGSITNLDLLDAQAAESAARLGNIQALFRLVMSKYELRRATGAEPLD